MQFSVAALLPIALAAVASSAPVSVDSRGFGDFVSDHINGIQDVAAGTVGGLAGAVGGPAGIVEGVGAGVGISNTIQSHTRRSAADAALVVEAIKGLERREDLTPAERGVIDFVKDHANGLEDIAAGTVGGLAGLEGGPVGVATGITTGVGISDGLQGRGLIGFVKDHANGLEDIAAGTAGGIAGAVYGGPIGAVTGVSGGVKASDELQSHTRRDGTAAAEVFHHGIDNFAPIVASPIVASPIKLAPASLKTPTVVEKRRIPEAALNDIKIGVPAENVKPALPTLVGGPVRFTALRPALPLKTPVAQAQG